MKSNHPSAVMPAQRDPPRHAAGSPSSWMAGTSPAMMTPDKRFKITGTQSSVHTGRIGSRLRGQAGPPQVAPSERPQEVEHGLLVVFREAAEFLHHGVRL